MTRRAVAFDLRGHGQSGAPTRDDYAMEALVGDLAAVVDELKLDRFVLVGHNLGAQVALAYAGRHPQRVAGLMLVGAPGKMPAERSRQIIKALESDYDKTIDDFWNKMKANAQPEVAKTLAAGRRRMPQDRSLSLIRTSFGYNPTGALQNYPGPKLILTQPGDNQSTALHALAPHAQHKVMEGTSHWLQMDKPEEFNRILDEFLHSVETRQIQRMTPLDQMAM